jgi:hypothetical protein
VRGAGSAVFAGILLMIIGTLDIIYGIVAISESKYFVGEHVFVFSDLKTWGWITLILGVIELTAALSLFAGGLYGRIVGVAAASLGAIGALLNVGGPHPWWSLGVFAVCIVVIHGLVVLEQPEV